MKEYTIKRSGILYWLATKPGGMTTWDAPCDLCSYVKRIILGLVVVLAATAAVGLAATSTLVLVLWPIYTTAVWIWGMVHTGVWTTIPVAAELLGAYIGFAALVFGSLGVMRVTNRIQDHASLEEAQPSVIRLWYKSFKEKTCVRIKFE